MPLALAAMTAVALVFATTVLFPSLEQLDLEARSTPPPVGHSAAEA